MKRSSALLAHISSLPGPFGHGTLGEETLAFGKRLRAAGFTYWQILPLGQPAIDSPYMCLSAYSGNTRMIDPRGLVEDGLLREEELERFTYRGPAHRTDYAFAHLNSRAYLDLAYSRIGRKEKRAISAFAAAQPWVRDYALFMVIRAQFGDAVWWLWPDKALAGHEEAALAAFASKHREAIRRQIFAQWVFERQWRKIKRALNALGLGIFGDMPYYVGHDSADVWANRALFSIAEDFLPVEVSGVPPDYFSADGQLWGTPVYNWKRMAEQGYGWWIERIRQELRRYDLLRIDHFRGLSAYWCVPYGDKTARRGRWRKGPGMALFKALKAELGELPIIAEDLGVVDAALLRLLDRSGFPRMKVLQFSLDPGSASTDLPHDYPRGSCAYTGTHDNNTSLGWLWELDEATRRHALAYCAFPEGADWGKGGPKSPACRAMIRTVWASASVLAVAPLQDYLGFGSDARMNLPSTEINCWVFRVPAKALEGLDWAGMAEQNALYQRDAAFSPPHRV